ncbi:MAG TPA: DUF433 domain-containing protein [Phenylobacterium sp.]|uniref:DUF433 domain-containing protein n=1 Tax=Phenylobacterium sp. TaxID=1871053 RepID=UPI002BD54FE6|nr:DUF433 domain-containing protein [Phenylobacterium sp.]HSV01817.1 DUF433 domain-containing protein [Phenylobacterium sp.]
MPDTAHLYTTAQAGAASGLNPKAVQNAIDKRIVEPVAAPRPAGVRDAGGARRAGPRMLTGEDLVRLRVWSGVGGIPAERRQAIFRAMLANPKARTVHADELLIVDVSAARRQVAENLRILGAAERAIHRDKAILGGEPVFKGTRIPAYGIAAMLDAGTPVAEILAGYPKLDERLLQLAKLWVIAHPRRGRPKSLRQMGLKAKSTRKVALRGDPLPDRTRSRSSDAR